MGVGRPAGAWGLRSRALPSGAERAAGCGRTVPGEAARRPQRSPGPRTCRSGEAGWSSERPVLCCTVPPETRKSSLPPGHCTLLLPLTDLVTGLWLSITVPLGRDMHFLFQRTFCLPLEFLGKLEGKAEPLILMFRGESQDSGTDTKLACLAEGHTKLRTRTQTPCLLIMLFLLHS